MQVINRNSFHTQKKIAEVFGNQVQVQVMSSGGQ